MKRTSEVIYKEALIELICVVESSLSLDEDLHKDWDVLKKASEKAYAVLKQEHNKVKSKPKVNKDERLVVATQLLSASFAGGLINDDMNVKEEFVNIIKLADILIKENARLK